jgi:hypothetical protein
MRAWEEEDGGEEIPRILSSAAQTTLFADVDLPIADKAKLACAILGIPVPSGKRGVIDAMRTFFEVYSAFDENAHFGYFGEGNEAGV